MSKSRDLGEFPAAALDIDASGNLDVTGTVTADGLTVAQNTGSKLTLSSTDVSIAGSDIIGEIDFFSADGSGIGAASRANISVVAADAAGAGDVYIKTSTGGSAVASRQKIANNGDISFYEDTGTTPKFFWDASAENLSLDSTGPYSLDISRNGGTDANTSIRFNQLSADWYAGANGSNNFGINTSADLTNALFEITSAGTVTLSSAIPDLVLASPPQAWVGGEDMGGVSWYTKDTSASGPANVARIYGESSGSNALPAVGLRFQTGVAGSLVDRVAIEYNGNVGIGTNSPLYGLDLDSSANSNLAARFRHSGLNDQQYGIRVETADDQNDNTRYFFNARGATTTRLTIYSTGDVKNSNNSYGALSDQKLKENITDSASQWDDLKAVRLRNYSMISDGEVNANRLGVIAQELEAAGMGGLVSEHDDLDENNESLGTTTKSVKYSILYLKAVGALQEAQTRVESLETLTQSLITRIEILEAK